jgi:glyoxylase-like metal-dependent hydrolase (beta-lactamase superfamily II)
MKRWRRLVTIVTAILILLAGLGLAFAPILYAEMGFMGLRPEWPLPLISAVRVAGQSVGTVVDDYWRVQQIAPDTYAIGEPQNDPDNYEYLLLGKTRALLIDSGATARDIHPVLSTLTQLPVTVIPTHLHYDHTNGLKYFNSIALIDLPETRSRVTEGMLHLGRYQYMDASDPNRAPVFQVTEWVAPDSYIDLGGRRVQVLWTPGHTATSLSIYDSPAKLLFTGDLIYTTTLYAFMPDSSLSTYEATADRLLAALPADTVIYGAHCCRNDAPAEAPWLGMNDLGDVRRAVQNIRNGQVKGQGLLIRRFPVNTRMTIVTFYPWGNR